MSYFVKAVICPVHANCKCSGKSELSFLLLRYLCSFMSWVTEEWTGSHWRTIIFEMLLVQINRPEEQLLKKSSLALALVSFLGNSTPMSEKCPYFSPALKQPWWVRIFLCVLKPGAVSLNWNTCPGYCHTTQLAFASKLSAHFADCSKVQLWFNDPAYLDDDSFSTDCTDLWTTEKWPVISGKFCGCSLFFCNCFTVQFHC